MTERKIPTHLHGNMRDPATGWPAPYVNAWSSEMVDTGWVISRFEGRPAFTMPYSPGVGTVDFRHQHMGRQRRIVTSHVCQVCRAPKAKNLIVGPGLSGEIIPIDGGLYVMFTEPWICTRCATFALDHCPGLIRKRRDDILDVITPNPRFVQTALSMGAHDRFPGVSGVMWAKVGFPLKQLPQAEGWFPMWKPDQVGNPA